MESLEIWTKMYYKEQTIPDSLDEIWKLVYYLIYYFISNLLFSTDTLMQKTNKYTYRPIFYKNIKGV